MYSQISYWAFRPAPGEQRKIIETMQLAKAAGFDGIELAIGSTGHLTPDTPARECRAIAAAAKAIRIKIGSVASGLLWEANPASSDRATRLKAVELTQKCLAVTAALGVGHLLVLPGHVDVFFKPQGEVVPYDACYARTVEFCKTIAKAAQRHKVTACVENVWNRFLMSPLEFRQLIEKVGSKYVAVYFDVGNCWLLGYPQHWIKILGKCIQRVHVKDFKRSVGTAAGFCNLLDGDSPLAESLKLLKKLKYNGPVTAEVFPGPSDLDERQFLKTTAERLDKLLP